MVSVNNVLGMPTGPPINPSKGILTSMIRWKSRGLVPHWGLWVQILLCFQITVLGVKHHKIGVLATKHTYNLARKQYSPMVTFSCPPLAVKAKKDSESRWARWRGCIPQPGQPFLPLPLRGYYLRLAPKWAVWLQATPGAWPQAGGARRAPGLGTLGRMRAGESGRRG